MAEAVQKQKPKVVILGAGPAGISAAWRLPPGILNQKLNDGAVGEGCRLAVGDFRSISRKFTFQ